MLPADQQLKYVPEIDGLRGISILLVLLFHLDYLAPAALKFLTFSGGYVGVDLFLVTSGYLVAKRSIRHYEISQFEFLSFMMRRISRLFPAAISMAVVTVTVGIVFARFGWITQERLSVILNGGVSHLLFYSNYYFDQTVFYFGAKGIQQPFLHTWSLTLEEQFYLLFAILLAATARFGRRTLFTLFLFFACWSFYYNLLSFPLNPGRAYYTLQGRGWVILLGCCVGLLPDLPVPRSTIHETIYTVVAAVCGFVFLFCAFCFTNVMQYPSWSGLIPSIAAVVLCVICNKSKTASKICAAHPITWLGKLSYSIYLWHWPMISYFYTMNLVGWIPMFTALFCSLALASISYYKLEQPFQYLQKSSEINRAKKTKAFIYLGCGWILALSISSMFLNTVFIPHKNDEVVERVVIERTRSHIADVDSDNVKWLGDTTQTEVDILLWGDSHAMAAAPAIETWLQQNHKKGAIVAFEHTVPVNIPLNLRAGIGYETPIWFSSTIQFIKRHSISTVIMFGNWSERSAAAVPGSVKTLVDETKARCIVFKTVPIFESDPQGLFRRNRRPLRVRKSIADEFPQPISEDVEAAGGELIDVRFRFLDSTGKSYVAAKLGKLLYCDEDHLTPDGARFAILPELNNLLGSSDTNFKVDKPE